MSNPDDDEKLLEVAASISDGKQVDWKAVRAQFAASDDARLVDELHLLNGIVAAHADAATWGNLQILEPLGQGSFATVYRAFDSDLQRDVALKICKRHPSETFNAQQAVQEARLLARVRHPNVVTVFGAQRRDDAIALAMELIKGQTLEELVSRNGAYSAEEATLIGLDLCRALAAVHEAGLIHGDVKAHNVMREEGGRIVLMDFGTGKDLKGPTQAAGDFAGTPVYMAPEVFRGRSRTVSADIYSLGVLLYYLSTGTYPVTGNTRTEIDRHHAQPNSRRLLRDVRPDLPDAFVRVGEQASAGTPSGRFQTAGAFEAALVASRGQQDQSNRRQFMRRSGIAAGVFLVLAVAGTSVYFALKDPAAPRIDAPPAPASTLAPASGAYRVEAAMYRVRDGKPARLQRSERLAPGDALYLQLQASVPTYAYVVNEDELGNSLLLFPLPGQPRTALPASAANRLPGLVGGEEQLWRVNAAGGREHFVIFVSPERLPEVEQLVASLPSPRRDAPIEYRQVPANILKTLRSVGGLTPAPNATRTTPRLSAQYTTPLSDLPEDARGIWVRQVAFDNPTGK